MSLCRLRLPFALAVSLFAAPTSFSQAPLRTPSQTPTIAEQAEAHGATPEQARSLQAAVTSTLSQQASLAQDGFDRETEDRFGFAVAVDGAVAVVGVPFQDLGSNDTDAGKIIIYGLQSDGTWTLRQNISNPTSSTSTATYSRAFDEFGISVAIDGPFIVVGAHFATNRAGIRGGAAYVFRQTTPTSLWTVDGYLRAGDTAIGDLFGRNVDIDGTRVVVGAAGNVSAYVFERTPTGTWPQTDQVTGPAGSQFGQDVAISGDFLLIGAPNETVGGNVGTGRAYVYKRQAGGTHSLTDTLEPSGLASQSDGSRFGGAVDIEGTEAVVGAHLYDTFVNSSFVVDGGYVFPYTVDVATGELTGGTLFAPSDLSSGDEFGRAVGVSAGRGVVGTPGQSNRNGAVYLYEVAGGTWTQSQKVVYGSPREDRLGQAVATSRGLAILGAPERTLQRSNGNVMSETGAALIYGTPAVLLTTVSKGWRTIAAPSDAETVGSLLEPLWTQGFPGADVPNGAPNVYFYDESVDGDLGDGYVAPSTASVAVPPGTGLLVYAFPDDDFDGLDDPFPKRLPLSGDEPTRPFTFPVTYTDTPAGDDVSDDGWNLLGNPFRTPLDWDDLYGNGGAQSDGDNVTNIDPTASVWVTTQGYLFYNALTNTGTLPNGEVPPGDGFFVRANATGPALTKGGGGGASRLDQGAVPHLVLRAHSSADGVEISGSAIVALVEGASSGADDGDSPLLAPLGAPHVTLGVARADGTPLAQSALPADLASGTEVDLALGVAGVANDASLTWDLALPDGWTATLIDRVAGTEAVLTEGGRFALDLTGVPNTVSTGRLALRLAGTSVAGPLRPEAGALALSAPVPNPASGEARVRLSVPEASDVAVRVYDTLGRLVQTAFEGSLAAGVDVVVGIGTGPLAPGLYVVRAEGAGAVVSRTLTVTR